MNEHEHRHEFGYDDGHPYEYEYEYEDVYGRQEAREDDPAVAHGAHHVVVPLTSAERALLEEIAAGWGVDVPLAAERLLLLAANVCDISPDEF
ncbi:hypothetical protein [Xylanimonas ulmi]|uniref:Uncharacterized protein n=1 Tax=Xylanimonas ulmi TaxID=228973 RepID=A0A4Q7M3W9_9MICO|nr:hypothetical protein [Xylanibacterium ulmi]RZS62244.1 hypothetical protein EV386_2569 [Xylanibacterium ulmi]